jgi:hypothetical protein
LIGFPLRWKSHGMIWPVACSSCRVRSTCASSTARSRGTSGNIRPSPFFVSPGSSRSQPAFRSRWCFCRVRISDFTRQPESSKRRGEWRSCRAPDVGSAACAAGLSPSSSQRASRRRHGMFFARVPPPTTGPEGARRTGRRRGGCVRLTRRGCYHRRRSKEGPHGRCGNMAEPAAGRMARHS